MARIVRLTGFNKESDIFVFMVKQFERKGSLAKKAYQKVWDFITIGKAKIAPRAIESLTGKFVIMIEDDIKEHVIEKVDNLMDVDNPRFIKMCGKVLAQGIVNDMLSNPLDYSKFLTSVQKQEVDDHIVNRGKKKMETMLDNKRHSSDNNEKIAQELIKIAKELVASPSYLRKLKKTKMGKGDYSWFGEIDGVNINVIRNSADPSVGTKAWFDITVGTRPEVETFMRENVSEKDVNEIIDRLLKEELKYREKMSVGVLSVNIVKDQLEDMRIEVSLSDSKIDKISKKVYKHLSEMDEKELNKMRRKGRTQVMVAEDDGDEEGLVEAALALIYAKVLLKMF